MINKPAPDNGDAEQRTDKSTPLTDEEVQRKLDEGDSDKIDAVLQDLGVSKTAAGADQTDKADTEGSNSSSKNLDEEST